MLRAKTTTTQHIILNKQTTKQTLYISQSHHVMYYPAPLLIFLHISDQRAFPYVYCTISPLFLDDLKYCLRLMPCPTPHTRPSFLFIQIAFTNILCRACRTKEPSLAFITNKSYNTNKNTLPK